MTKIYPVTALLGDGIGPEIMRAARRVMNATGVGFHWDIHPYGAACPSEINSTTGEEFTPIPHTVINSMLKRKLVLKCPTASEGNRRLNVDLRKALNLSTNIRPTYSIPRVLTPYSDRHIDVVIFREGVEDFYIGEERYVGEDAEATSRITVEGCVRVARVAFEYARAHGRKRMTIIHKANILKKTHGLFLNIAKKVATGYPEVVCDDLIADNFMLQFVRAPERFDCLLAPNFIGDLISDLAAGVVHGSLGFAAGLNVGHVGDAKYAVAEAVHGTAPDIAGKGIANPSALILSGSMLLDYVGEKDAAHRIRYAIRKTLQDDIHTGDVSREGAVGTDAFTDAVIERL